MSEQRYITFREQQLRSMTAIVRRPIDGSPKATSLAGKICREMRCEARAGLLLLLYGIAAWQGFEDAQPINPLISFTMAPAGCSLVAHGISRRGSMDDSGTAMLGRVWGMQPEAEEHQTRP